MKPLEGTTDLEHLKARVQWMEDFMSKEIPKVVLHGEIEYTTPEERIYMDKHQIIQDGNGQFHMMKIKGLKRPEEKTNFNAMLQIAEEFNSAPPPEGPDIQWLGYKRMED